MDNTCACLMRNPALRLVTSSQSHGIACNQASSTNRIIWQRSRRIASCLTCTPSKAWICKVVAIEVAFGFAGGGATVAVELHIVSCHLEIPPLTRDKLA